MKNLYTARAREIERAEAERKLRFIVITETADGKTLTSTITATSAREAHEVTEKPDGSIVRIYADTADADGYGIMRGALSVARRCADRTNAGTDTQKRILDDLNTANGKASNSGSAVYLFSLLGKMGADAQDYHAKAYEAIIQSMARGESIDEQYHNAFIAVNTHIMKSRSASKAECSTEYIQDCNGDIISLGTFTARLLNADDRYTPTENNDLTAEEAEHLGRVLSECYSRMTATQKQIVRYLAKGYSQKRIAEKMGRARETVKDHIDIIRKKTFDHITETAPEFLALVDVVGLTEKRTDRHTDKSKSKHAERNAEYCRQYRERKKLEAMMKNNR